MKTNMGKFLGSAVLLALFTAGCASDDAAGAPPTVIIERDQGASTPVIIEREVDNDKPVIIERDVDDKELKVDVDVDKD